jgi:hypothetical protein
MSDYERKYQRATAELENAGLQERGVTPPVTRFLRKIGCEPRPQYYRTTVSRFAYDPLILGGAWGLGMFFVTDVPVCLIAMFVLVSAAFGYLLTGLSEITILRQRKRQNLSNWEDF